jgi:hypothetical protein
MATRRSARSIVEILLLAFVSVPFVFMIYDAGSTLSPVLLITALIGACLDVITHGELGFGRFEPMMRVVVLLGAMGALVSAIYLLTPPIALYASASLGIAVGFILVRLTRLVE